MLTDLLNEERLECEHAFCLQGCATLFTGQREREGESVREKERERERERERKRDKEREG